MKVYPDLDRAQSAHAGRTKNSSNQRYIMLTIGLLSLVLIPVVVDIALRGRHRTIELSMVRPD